MPRPARKTSIDEIVREAMEGIVQRASIAIARAISEMAAERIDSELRRGLSGSSAPQVGRPPGPRARRAGTEITRWAADRRARRVPNFVIAQTGLKTKKAVVEKYGSGAVFQKGKQAPKK